MTQKLYFQKYTIEKLLDNCTKSPASDIYKDLVIIALNNLLHPGDKQRCLKRRPEQEVKEAA